MSAKRFFSAKCLEFQLNIGRATNYFSFRFCSEFVIQILEYEAKRLIASLARLIKNIYGSVYQGIIEESEQYLLVK